MVKRQPLGRADRVTVAALGGISRMQIGWNLQNPQVGPAIAVHTVAIIGL